MAAEVRSGRGLQRPPRDRGKGAEDGPCVGGRAVLTAGRRRPALGDPSLLSPPPPSSRWCRVVKKRPAPPEGSLALCVSKVGTCGAPFTTRRAAVCTVPRAAPVARARHDADALARNRCRNLPKGPKPERCPATARTEPQTVTRLLFASAPTQTHTVSPRITEPPRRADSKNPILVIYRI